MIAGFQGVRGAFSEEAALLLLGICDTRGFLTFDALLDALLRGDIDRAVLPIENSIAGRIEPAVQALAQRAEINVLGELTHRIDQCLIALPGASLQDLTTAASHPVALAQCRNFFATYHHIAPRDFYDTAAAVAELERARDVRQAAVGPARCANVYGAIVLMHAIQDDPENRTRFLLLSA